ncbi:hypothetical protein BS47DRAFT_1352972, partial [Hydnum rufescens UP504]
PGHPYVPYLAAKSHNLGVIVANAQLADSDGLKMVIEPEGDPGPNVDVNS